MAPQGSRREPLDERRCERHRPQREQRAGEEENGGCGHEERVDAEAALVGDEGTVVPAELPVAEEREPGDEEVEVRSLREPCKGGPAALACDRHAPARNAGSASPRMQTTPAPAASR